MPQPNRRAAAAADSGIRSGLGRRGGLHSILLDAPLAAKPRGPVCRAGEPGPLHWASTQDREQFARAPYGLEETTDRLLDPEFRLRVALLVFVPALAVRFTGGVRLGPGCRASYDSDFSISVGPEVFDRQQIVPGRRNL